MQIRVYHEDTDAQGVVFHSNYLKYMDRARNEWLLSIGFDALKMAEEDAIFVVYTAEQKFTYPAKLYDSMYVTTNIVQVGRSYITFEQIVHDTENVNLVFCYGKAKLACVNQEFKPRILPNIVSKGAYKQLVTRVVPLK